MTVVGWLDGWLLSFPSLFFFFFFLPFFYCSWKLLLLLKNKTKKWVLRICFFFLSCFIREKRQKNFCKKNAGINNRFIIIKFEKKKIERMREKGHIHSSNSFGDFFIQNSDSKTDKTNILLFDRWIKVKDRNIIERFSL